VDGVTVNLKYVHVSCFGWLIESDTEGTQHAIGHDRCHS
jgi:hypothetical protein